MSVSTDHIQGKASYLHLLQRLQNSQPHAQIALLQFEEQAGAIALARKGVPIHLEKFRQIGLTALLQQYLTHPAPDALQAERAIEHIEEAIMPAQLDLRQFQVFTADQHALALLDWVQALNQQTHKTLSLDTVETCFNLYAQAAIEKHLLGHIPAQPKLWAYLILLREAMHHMCIEQVHVLSD